MWAQSLVDRCIHHSRIEQRVHRRPGGARLKNLPQSAAAGGADGIGHGAAMAAGARDQPAMGRGLGIRHQLWDATAKGTATR